MLQCVVNVEENSQTAPSPWDFVTQSEEDRATAIVARRVAWWHIAIKQHTQKFGKDRACDSGDIIADRQTDTQTHTDTHRHTRTLY